MSRVIKGLLCCILLFWLTACASVYPETTPDDTTQAPASNTLPEVSEAPSSDPAEPGESNQPEDHNQASPEPSIIGAASTTSAPEAPDNSATVSSKWPDNEFTKQIPQLTTGTILMSLTQGNSFELTASDISLEATKEYIDASIAIGFTQNADLHDYTESGIEAYTYSANNQNGYKLCISYSVGLLSLSVEK